MKAALIHRITLMLLAITALCSCGEDPANAGLKKEVAELSAAVKAAREDINGMRAKVDLLIKERDDLVKERLRLQAEAQAALQASAAKQESATNAAETRTASRANARGAALGKLQIQGKTYEDVKISEVNSAGMQFTHARGISTFPWKLLPAELHERFKVTAEELSGTAATPPAQAPAATAPPPPAPAPAATSPAAASPPSAAAPTSATETLEQVRKKIAELNAGLKSAQQEMERELTVLDTQQAQSKEAKKVLLAQIQEKFDARRIAALAELKTLYAKERELAQTAKAPR